MLATSGATQPQRRLPAVALALLCVVCLGCAYVEGRDHAKWSYAKNVNAYGTDSQHWHDNPAHTCALWFKGEAPYYAGETADWLRKCQGKITAKFFDALEWTIITALSRKVAQLTEIHAWGIIVVKNTLLLMTFHRNFYSEGILNLLNARQREHCR